MQAAECCDVRTREKLVCNDMGTHMKTTIEIADALLEEAKEVARAEGTTLRALVEEGLRTVTSQRQDSRAKRKLKDLRYKGKGWLRPEFRQGGWEAIRDEIYRGRGS